MFVCVRVGVYVCQQLFRVTFRFRRQGWICRLARPEQRMAVSLNECGVRLHELRGVIKG